jgi:hypothetical protein
MAVGRAAGTEAKQLQLHGGQIECPRESVLQDGRTKRIPLRNPISGTLAMSLGIFTSRSASLKNVAAANIRYFLSATTWHYYRFYFGFGLNESIECARTAVMQAADALRRRRKD